MLVQRSTEAEGLSGWLQLIGAFKAPYRALRSGLISLSRKETTVRFTFNTVLNCKKNWLTDGDERHSSNTFHCSSHSLLGCLISLYGSSTTVSCTVSTVGFCSHMWAWSSLNCRIRLLIFCVACSSVVSSIILYLSTPQEPFIHAAGPYTGLSRCGSCSGAFVSYQRMQVYFYVLVLVPLWLYGIRLRLHHLRPQ